MSIAQLNYAISIMSHMSFATKMDKIVEKFKAGNLSVFITLCALLASPSAPAQQSRAFPVRVVNAVEMEAAPTSWVPGTVIGRDDSKLSAEVDGKLEQVLEVGDRIAAGGTIARLDPITFEFQVAEAKAEIISLQAKLDFYHREVKRLETLAKMNNAAKNRLDEVSSDYADYTGRLEAARTRLAQAQDRLRRTGIKAPFPGVVTERYQAKGERISAGTPILRLVNLESLEIQARVPQTSIAYLKPGIMLDVFDGETSREASVRAIVPVGDDISRLYELRMNYDNPVWMVGQAVRVAVPVSNKRTILAVPRDALVIRQSDIKIFRVNEKSVAEAVAVKTGLAHGDMIEIIGDVRPQDLVVTRGNERLRPGMEVMIQERSEQP